MTPQERRLDCYNRIVTLINKEGKRLDEGSREIPWAMTNGFLPLKAVETGCIESSLLRLKREIAEVLRETFPVDSFAPAQADEQS
jgi:hypothetical protein